MKFSSDNIILEIYKEYYNILFVDMICDVRVVFTLMRFKGLKFNVFKLWDMKNDLNVKDKKI